MVGKFHPMIGCLCKYQRDLYLFRYLYPDPPLPRSRLWIPLIRNSQGRLNIHRQAGVSTTVAPSPRENKHAEYSSQCESHHPTNDPCGDGSHVSLGIAVDSDDASDGGDVAGDGAGFTIGWKTGGGGGAPPAFLRLNMLHPPCPLTAPSCQH